MTISVKNILAVIAALLIIVLAVIYVPRVIHDIYPPVNNQPLVRQTPPIVSDTIPVGFYNVENLFDLNYDGGEYPEYRPGALGWNQQTFDKKIANISAVIAALNVDIIGLCEIENRSALEALRNVLKKRGCEYPFFAIADFQSRGSTCSSLLSKYPVLRSREIRAPGQGRRGRSILEADIDCGAEDTLKVFVNHWPSKMHPESQRLVMAEALRNRLEALHARCDYIIIGDLNTDYDEWSKVHASGLDDTKGRVGLNHCLKTIHGGPDGFISYVNKDEMCRGDGLIHYDLWLEKPEMKRFSRIYRSDLETLDHVLFPRSMFDSSGLSYCNATFQNFTWNDTLLKNGEPFRWQMKGFGKRRFHAGEGYSDHLPLRVCLVRRPWRCGATGGTATSGKRGVQNSGFELSMEGWAGCGRAIEVRRDTVKPFSGRYCLRLSGAPGKNNCCAGKTVICRGSSDGSRSVKLSFAIRGEGKLSIRVRSHLNDNAASSKWQYYKGETFTLCGSSRFLPVRFPAWKTVVLTYTAGSALTKEIDLEIRAGKESPFCFYLDAVRAQ